MRSRIDVRRLAACALLAAMALAVQWLEGLLPPLIPAIPVRLGLANIFTLYALLTLSKRDAFAVSAVRVLLYPLVTGAVSGFLYSATGSLFSYAVMAAMLPLFTSGRVSAVSLSVAGAFCFNLGQLLVGVLVIGPAMAAYFPWMGLLSVPAGICTGLLCALIRRRMPRS